MDHWCITRTLTRLRGFVFFVIGRFSPNQLVPMPNVFKFTLLVMQSRAFLHNPHYRAKLVDVRRYPNCFSVHSLADWLAVFLPPWSMNPPHVIIHVV